MDREKVIKGLEICKPSKYSRTCGICPYREEMNCDYEVYNDALALLKQEAVVPLTIDDAVSEIMDKHYKRLKEQEAVEPFHRCIGKDFSLIEDSHFDYCPYCGKPITWEGR